MYIYIHIVLTICIYIIYTSIIYVAEAKCGFYCEVRTLDPQEVGVRMVGDGPGSNG